MRPATSSPLGLPADHAARKDARTIFDRPLILEAGAGTGKTGVLVERILCWCLGPGFERARRRAPHAAPARHAADVFDRVVAVTFTEKAAEEMTARVLASLGALREGHPVRDVDAPALGLRPVEIRDRANALLLAIDHLQASTIHAFCRRILAGYTDEAGLHPAFVVDAEESATSRAIEQVLAEGFAKAFATDATTTDDLLALSVRGITPDDLGETLLGFVREGVRPADLEGLDSRERLARAQDDLRTLCDEILDVTRPRKDAVKRAKAAVAAIETLESLRGELTTDLDLGRLVTAARGAVLETKLLERLKKWSGGDLSNTEAEAFAGGIDRLAAASAKLRRRLASLGDFDPAVFRHGARALGRLLEAVQRRLHRAGVLGFHDLLEKTRELLAHHPSVRAGLRARIDQLLVDEFQDTDPIQYELVEWIALDGPQNTRPGLFLVGDPKQSIYGWRRADLRAYEAFRARVTGAEGGLLRALTVNFRSVAPILDEVERVVAPAMIADPGIQPAFERLLPGRETKQHVTSLADRVPAVEHWIAWAPEDPEAPPKGGQPNWGWKTPAARAREIEARAIVHDLLALQRRTEFAFRWQHAAILFRSNAAAETCLAALRDAGIPFHVERDTGFFRRREVIDAVSLLGAIVDPHDQVALLGFLRSPSVGVPDFALLPLFEAGLPDLAATLLRPTPAATERLDALMARARTALPPEAVGKDEVPDFEVALHDGLRALAVLRASLAADPADLFLDRVRNLLLTDLSEAARPRGEYRLANLDRLFAKLFRAFTEQFASPEALRRELARALDEERAESEGRPADPKLDAVRVMTIHKAKGLTFRQVYVADLAAPARGRSDRSRPVVEHGRHGVELRFLGVDTLGLPERLDLVERTARAELSRLLYVAATRPEERLVLSGRFGDPSKAVPTEGHSLADLVRRRPDLPLDELGRWAEDGEGAEHRDRHGVLWRCLGAVPEVAGDDRAPVPTTTPSAVLAHAAKLDVARDAAALRMRRKLTAPASADAHRAEDAERADDDERDALPGGNAVDPGLARHLGSAIHRSLEDFDVDRDYDDALGAAKSRLPRHLAERPPETDFGAATTALEALFDRVAANGWYRRLMTLRSALIAREVPVILAGDAANAEDPLGAKIGAIDLLLRDPANGDFVVVDYKTDETTEREAAYRLQGAVYCEAIRRSLSLAASPRFELWWLAASPAPPP